MDDGSSDGTAALVAEYIKKDVRVIHVRHDENCGLPALRVNEGLMLARGRYIAYQFDDDQWHEKALEWMIGELENDPSYDVAYGQCSYHENGNDYLLGDEFDYGKLLNCNYIANNSVVHRREVFEKYGGYDMHVCMKRLCDWDLWLRWGKKVRFKYVKKVVSYVEAAKENSLGKTIHYDSFAARAYMALDRDELLVPSSLENYELDDLASIQHLGVDKIDEIWRTQIASFQCLHKNIWTAVKPKRDKAIHVVVTKAHYDTTIDITINNFKEFLKGNFAFTFVPQSQVTTSVVKSCDILLLHRTIDDGALKLLVEAKKLGKAVIFLMDDDLLSFHEISEAFSYLRPGSPLYSSLESIIKESDLVLTYSRLMQESVSKLNKRNILLETNISSKWLSRAKEKIKKIESHTSEKVKIAFSGSGARKEEFEILWKAIVDISDRYLDAVEFHFWGIEPDKLAQLKSAYVYEPFTFSYEEYLGRLVASNFDIMLAPLFAEKRAKQAKCPIKFLEISAAGAIGIYSDVEPYECVIDGQSGIKTYNSVESWYSALIEAIEMPVSNRKEMLATALNCIENSFTTESQVNQFQAALNAGLCFSQRNSQYSDQTIKIAYVSHSPYLGGAENHLLRHAMIARSYNFEPIFVFPRGFEQHNEEMQRRVLAAGMRIAYLPLIVETEIDESRVLEIACISEIENWLQRESINLVHSVTLMRELGEACRITNIPHVNSLYATESNQFANVQHCDYVHSDSFLYANKWSGVLGAKSRRILTHVPDDYFKLGSSNCNKNFDIHNIQVGLFGSIQPRKGQFQAIQAVKILRDQYGINVSLHIYGYDHFFQDYTKSCYEFIKKNNLENSIFIHGFVNNTAQVLQDLDVVLCASDWESLPQVILEGMAAKKIIVTPKVGGISEVISEYNGILIKGNSAENIASGLKRVFDMPNEVREKRVESAFRTVYDECHIYSVAESLLYIYQYVLIQKRHNLTNSSSTCAIPSNKTYKTPDMIGRLESLRHELNQINAQIALQLT